MIFLDTTVLVYAVGGEHPLRQACRAIIRAVQRGDVTARTSVEVIQELAHVRARRCGRHDAALVAREFAGLLQPLVVVDELDLKRGLELFDRTASLGAFDCVLAATAMRRGASLVSADNGFSQIDGLAALNPAIDLDRIMAT